MCSTWWNVHLFFFLWKTVTYCMCVTYHQVRTAKPRGAVTVMISVRQSFTRKANPAKSMLPRDQDRLPITPINDLWLVSTHSIPAGWGKWLKSYHFSQGGWLNAHDQIRYAKHEITDFMAIRDQWKQTVNAKNTWHITTFKLIWWP